MTHRQLINTLRAQHFDIKETLLTFEKEISSDSANAEKYFGYVTVLRAQLEEHLQLENEVFYPEVFKVLKKVGNEVGTTEDFVDQVNTLSETVENFLDKYSTKEKITGDLKEFKDKMEDIAGKIILRISLEEESVFMYLA